MLGDRYEVEGKVVTVTTPSLFDTLAPARVRYFLGVEGEARVIKKIEVISATRKIRTRIEFSDFTHFGEELRPATVVETTCRDGAALCVETLKVQVADFSSKEAPLSWPKSKSGFYLIHTGNDG